MWFSLAMVGALMMFTACVTFFRVDNKPFSTDVFTSACTAGAPSNLPFVTMSTLLMSPSWIWPAKLDGRPDVYTQPTGMATQTNAHTATPANRFRHSNVRLDVWEC
jgi:hypothetical protein